MGVWLCDTSREGAEDGWREGAGEGGGWGKEGGGGGKKRSTRSYAGPWIRCIQVGNRLTPGDPMRKQCVEPKEGNKTNIESLQIIQFEKLFAEVETKSTHDFIHHLHSI